MADPAAEPVRRKPGRKPRFLPEELRQRTLDAALQAVFQKGVGSGLDAIRIERVIQDADVPRAATYELWDAFGAGTSQENLRRATVIDIVRNMPAGNSNRTAEFAFTQIEAHQEVLASGTIEELRATRSEILRLTAGFNFEQLQDQRWRVYKTLASSIGTSDDEELRAALAEGEEHLIVAYGQLFTDLAEVFRLELRSPYKMTDFIVSAYALNEGLSNRVGTVFENQTVMRDGKEWTVFAASLEALINHYFAEI